MTIKEETISSGAILSGPRFITVKDFAEMTGYSSSRIAALVRSGKLRGLRTLVGQSDKKTEWLVPFDEVFDYRFKRKAFGVRQRGIAGKSLFSPENYSRATKRPDPRQASARADIRISGRGPSSLEAGGLTQDVMLWLDARNAVACALEALSAVEFPLFKEIVHPILTDELRFVLAALDGEPSTLEDLYRQKWDMEMASGLLGRIAGWLRSRGQNLAAASAEEAKELLARVIAYYASEKTPS